MSAKVIKLNPEKPDQNEINEAAKLIDSGELVAFPTETVYGIACRVQKQSLESLNKLKGRSTEKYYTLHIPRKEDIEKYVPSMNLRTRKLIENTWPGPLTIVFELNKQDIDIQQKKIDREVFECLYKDNSIGVRCPDHAVASMLLQSTKYPVVAPSANKAGQKPANNAEEALEKLSSGIKAILDAGQCKHKKSSTVIKIGRKNFEILRSGVYNEENLKKFSEIKFLFVCTGNTCRSPMAEGLFAKYLAEKLQCKVDQLEENGYKSCSAGVMGITAMPASPESIAACVAMGVDIENHRSTALSKTLVEESDYIFVMSHSHQQYVIGLSKQASQKCMLLAENREIPDPIGQSQDVYNTCAKIIQRAVRKRISELKI